MEITLERDPNRERCLRIIADGKLYGVAQYQSHGPRGNSYIVSDAFCVPVYVKQGKSKVIVYGDKIERRHTEYARPSGTPSVALRPVKERLIEKAAELIKEGLLRPLDVLQAERGKKLAAEQARRDAAAAARAKVRTDLAIEVTKLRDNTPLVRRLARLVVDGEYVGISDLVEEGANK